MPKDWCNRTKPLPIEEEIRRNAASDMKKLKQLEDENARLKRLVADLSMDKAIL
jgi:hypothetical protein